MMIAASSAHARRAASRPPNRAATRPSSRLTIHSALWSAQVLLALIFLFAGVLKLAMPVDDLTEETALPGAFLRSVAVLEVLGALGLVLPGLLRVGRAFTPLAATGLVAIMIGATVTTLVESTAVAALLPVLVGVVAALVVYGRRSWLGGALRPPAGGL
jgi:hypothetical protein